MNEPTFPPLMSGERVEGGIDPFEKACAMAALGCDAGRIVYDITADRLAAALVVAPEVPLEAAMAVLPACGIGFQNALGALGPPEVAVHLEWDGGIRVNGGACGRLRAMADTSDPRAEPSWLVIGLDVPLMQLAARPGDRPDQTALYEEGCADVDPVALLESWARHTLVWINRWEDAGARALQSEWRGLVDTIGEDVTRNGLTGTFLGVDENFGMLLRAGEATHLVPLSKVLEQKT
ncbi:biotin/lipoate--protein ligase family protein [Roseovarius salinarum]|uniref:biotin/lipoate--protein ligase family protein n=1 Tax=Roseovarius salinarum TaxID=1981892 RepID=UPI000C341D5D|nr:biotin/lipoate--protein ligase family protein [Roseovarius salinarum]